MEGQSVATTGENLLDALNMRARALPSEGTISTWSESCVEFIKAIQRVFRMGRKKGFGAVFGVTPSFWPFVREFSSPATLERVQSLGNQFPAFKTLTGKEAAWVICVLNNGELRIYLDVIKRSPKLVNSYYNDSAETVLTKEASLERFTRILSELENTSITFDLDYGEYADILAGTKAPEPAHDTSQAVALEDREVTPADAVEEPQERNETPLYSSPNNQEAVQEEAFSKQTVPNDVGSDLPAEPKQQAEEPKRSPFQIPTKEYSPSPQEQAQESPVSIPGPSQGRRASRRELMLGPLHSTTNSERTDESTEDDAGREEIQEIIAQPKAKEVIIVRDSSDGSEYNPVLVQTPVSVKSEEKPIENNSPFEIITNHSTESWYDVSETSFFGIPWLVSGLERFMDKLADELEYVGKIFKELTEMVVIDDGVDSIVPTPEDLVRVFDSPLIKGNNQSFRYEYRVCPTQGLAKQGNKCWKCNQPLEEEDAHLCDVSGNYYCDNCLGDESIITPARILTDWDFEERQVQKDLAQNYRDHFGLTKIPINEVAPLLIDQIPRLRSADRLRTQIHLATLYIQDCPNRGHIHDQGIRRGLYTINELREINDDLADSKLKAHLKVLRDHIENECDRCRSMGKRCQVCQNEDLLFLFDENVLECPQCKSLAHIDCTRALRECVNCRRVYLNITSPSVDLPSMVDFIISQ